MRLVFSVLPLLLLVSCGKSTNDEYTVVRIKNSTGVDISNIQYLSKIDDGREVSISFGSLTSGATTEPQRVLCSVYSHDAFNSGVANTYNIAVQYTDSIPQSVTVLNIDTSEDISYDPRSLRPDESYLITLQPGGATLAEQ